MMYSPPPPNQRLHLARALYGEVALDLEKGRGPCRAGETLIRSMRAIVKGGLRPR